MKQSTIKKKMKQIGFYSIPIVAYFLLIINLHSFASIKMKPGMSEDEFFRRKCLKTAGTGSLIKIFVKTLAG